jgi:predicted TIM-barrel fold metal-dependent hydrolase
MGIHISKVIEEVRGLPLKPEVVEKWLGGNAARLFELD